MASISVPATGEKIDDPAKVAEFLIPLGILHEEWPVEGRIGPDASAEEILTAYKPEIDRLKAGGGYVVADVINVTPETPGLEEMTAKFDKEHTHVEDEIRFTVRGHGVFWINTEGAVPVFAIEVGPGDLIKVPAGARHWFHLCDDKTIRCIRLFKDPAGWTPDYLNDGIHGEHPPVCWGPSYLPAQGILTEGEEPIDGSVKI